jgi:hypothetical protein
MPEGMSVKQIEARLKVLAERRKRQKGELDLTNAELKQVRERLKAAKQPAGG